MPQRLSVKRSVTAAVAGLGLVTMTVGGCARELADGLLVRVLRDWDMGTVVLHAVFPAGRAAKPSARAFSDFVSTIMRRYREMAHSPGRP
jgi:DNA-binding transcriptional LysR family regulator